MLTDGANTQSVAPQTAAQEAALRRARVFTIGFGTPNPAPRMVCDNSQFDGRGFDGRGGIDRGRKVRMIHEPALKQIAQTSGGSYHRTENADQLQGVLNALPGSFTVIHQRVDRAAVLAAGGAILVTTALSFSLVEPPSVGRVLGAV
ncbi:hypothetical protein [Nonomuraea sp. NPDC003709]|uniref:hypothetical protein n=1 Tax=Nonomuraea sp. NPDC003709 TaxID=3154450 RepID=UPI0033B09B48